MEEIMKIDTDENAIDAQIGRNLRRMRKLKKLSQTALGAPVGVSFQQVQKYEKGTNRIAVSRLVQFSLVLGAPLADFFTDIGVGETGKNPMNEMAPETLNVARDLELIPDASIRRRVADLIRTLAQTAGAEALGKDPAEPDYSVAAN